MQWTFFFTSVRQLANDANRIDIGFSIRGLHDLLRLEDIGAGVGIVGDGECRGVG
jgi:hypothetical protein